MGENAISAIKRYSLIPVLTWGGVPPAFKFMLLTLEDKSRKRTQVTLRFVCKLSLGVGVGVFVGGAWGMGHDMAGCNGMLYFTMSSGIFLCYH